MNAISPLLSSFFKHGHAQFAFIHDMKDFNCVGGLVDYRGGRKLIRSFNPHSVVPNDLRDIWAVIRFERDNFALEIGFGDMDMRLNVHLSYDPIYCLPLDDVLRAHSVISDMSVYQWIKSDDIMRRGLGDIAKTVRHNKRFVFKNDTDIIQDIHHKAAQKICDTLAAQYTQTLSSISRLSHQAFAAQDYRRVIKLLRPHKRYLDAHMLHILQQAQQFIVPKF